LTKYSLILPYYKRPELVFFLMDSVDKYTMRYDFEIIIVEDSKNFRSEIDHERLMNIIEAYGDKLFIRHIVDCEESYCSAHKYNMGVATAEGQVILLSNPEIVHIGDVLLHLDNKDILVGNQYYVYDCESVYLKMEDDRTFSTVHNRWYQHLSINRQYHFLSAILKDDYERIGGFDERYSGGLGYEDDSFIMRVRRNRLFINCVSDPYCQHIEHSRRYEMTPKERERLIDINRKIWEKDVSLPF
jgi:hypothetical protein